MYCVIYEATKENLQALLECPRTATRRKPFSTSPALSKLNYKAVITVCEVVKSAFTFSISVIFSKRIKEMNQTPRETEQASMIDFHTFIYFDICSPRQIYF